MTLVRKEILENYRPGGGDEQFKMMERVDEREKAVIGDRQTGIHLRRGEVI